MLSKRIYKTKPGPAVGTTYPHKWVSGPDPLRHQQYLIWLQQRNQARYRGEVWLLDFEQWLTVWQPYWHQRGRGKDNVCMTRTDYDGAWEASNIEIITRAEHNKRQKAYCSLHGLTKGYKKRSMANA